MHYKGILWLHYTVYCSTPPDLRIQLHDLNFLSGYDIQAAGHSAHFGRVMFRRRRYTPARLSCTPLWSMRVPLTRLLNGSKTVMLSMAGCFFPRYSYEPLHSEFRANTPLGTKGEKVKG